MFARYLTALRHWPYHPSVVSAHKPYGSDIQNKIKKFFQKTLDKVPKVNYNRKQEVPIVNCIQQSPYPTSTIITTKIQQEDKTIITNQIALHNRIITPYNNNTFTQPINHTKHNTRKLFSQYELTIILLRM